MAGDSTSLENSIAGGADKASAWLNDNSDLIVQYGVNIISAILILFIGNIIVKMIAGSIAKILEKKNMDKTVVEFIHGLIRYLLFVIVFNLLSLEAENLRKNKITE